MALVPSLDVDDVDEKYRPLLVRPINLFRALINAPEGFSKFHAIAEWVRWECELDPRLRELLILQVGYLMRDEYEWSHHIQLSAQFGVTDDDIRALIDHAEGRRSTLGRVELLVLKATTQLTLDRTIDMQLWTHLEDEFSAERLTEIVMIASFYSMVARVLGGLRIEVEEDFARFLKKFPLPRAPYVSSKSTSDDAPEDGR